MCGKNFTFESSLPSALDIDITTELHPVPRTLSYQCYEHIMYQINVAALVSDTQGTCEILNSKLGVTQTANTNLQVFSRNVLVVLLEYGQAVGQLVEALR
jgi:hypothetical protein